MSDEYTKPKWLGTDPEALWVLPEDPFDFDLTPWLPLVADGWARTLAALSGVEHEDEFYV